MNDEISLNLMHVINKYKKLDEHFKIYEEEKKKVIEEEIEIFKKFFEKIKPYYPYKVFFGQKYYQIYRYENSKNVSISPVVYYCEDGTVRYAVLDVNVYKSYNPEVKLMDGAPFAIVTLEKIFENLELFDIISYMTKRIKTLETLLEENTNMLYGKRSSLDDFKEIIEKLD